MSALFGFLGFITLIVLIIGLIRPSLNPKEPTRKGVLKKFGPISCILIALSIFTSGALTDNHDTKVRTAEEIAQQAEQQRLNLAAEEYVKLATEKGLIVRIIPEVNQVFVEPSLWHGLDYETKERTAAILARYCGMKSEIGGELVEKRISIAGRCWRRLG